MKSNGYIAGLRPRSVDIVHRTKLAPLALAFAVIGCASLSGKATAQDVVVPGTGASFPAMSSSGRPITIRFDETWNSANGRRNVLASVEVNGEWRRRIIQWDDARPWLDTANHRRGLFDWANPSNWWPKMKRFLERQLTWDTFTIKAVEYFSSRSSGWSDRLIGRMIDQLPEYEAARTLRDWQEAAVRTAATGQIVSRRMAESLRATCQRNPVVTRIVAEIILSG